MMWNTIFDMLITAAIPVMLMMLVLWLVHLPLKNAAIVDVGWSLGIPIVACVFAVMGPGMPERRLLITTMACVWGLRLAWHLAVRIFREVEEDGRYKELRRSWGTNIPLKFFFFFQFQAGLDVLLALPFLLVCLNDNPSWSPFEWAGLVIWVIALTGEAFADLQLKAFKSEPGNKGRVCQIGLWRYSRHPNYFFEWLIWVGFAVFAMGSPYGWLGWLSPALLLYFLLRVTGIPATEAQALRGKGDAYRIYQRTTSAFIPWFRREVV